MIEDPRTKLELVDSDDHFEDDSDEILKLDGENYFKSDEQDDLLAIIDAMGDDANLLFDPSWEKDIND